jgi:hypothetical protein
MNYLLTNANVAITASLMVKIQFSFIFAQHILILVSGPVFRALSKNIKSTVCSLVQTANPKM